jgi:4-diphosphocytidyl-2-C-methyl-D-erythritol kinase
MPASTDHSLELLAPAKVNLFLDVHTKRQDGYHDLRSIITPISLCDRVVLTLRPDGEISCEMHGEQAPPAGTVPEASNLAYRAAVGLLQATGLTCGVHIDIEKRIPAGAGMGGGSADAAAVLRGLNRLWGADLDITALCAIGFSLGCDVPAMIHGCAVRVEGVGERVEPIPLTASPRRDWLVLANPRLAVETVDIYKRYSKVLTSDEAIYRNMASVLAGEPVGRPVLSLFNSLQDTVFHKYPLIEMLADTLLETGACGVLVSGSGGTIFGLADDRAHAESLRKQLENQYGEAVWSRTAQLMPDSVMVAHGPLTALV